MLADSASLIAFSVSVELVVFVMAEIHTSNFLVIRVYFVVRVALRFLDGRITVPITPAIGENVPS